MIQFILNNNEVSTHLPPGMLLLDYVRYHQHLTGTKIGCREGDCGACANLVGELKNGEVIYRSFTSCLTPLGNVHGKHVVTIEGTNVDGLNLIQEAMTECAATQCGFCTPGFVVSMAGFCLSNTEPSAANAIAAIDGNICRCTGYKSIERAALQVAVILQQQTSGGHDITSIADNRLLPAYFTTIKARLQQLLLASNSLLHPLDAAGMFAGGGTDLYVQKHDEMTHASIHFMYNKIDLKYIRQEGNLCVMGPSVTVADLQVSPLFLKHFPAFPRHVKLISSTPIRNMATIAGNFVNASPIGDFTIFFLALNATVTLSNGTVARKLPLRQLYKGYKTLDKTPEEFIEQITFELPGNNDLFNFEKVSKRTHLDIASVNTALYLQTDNQGNISRASLSAGGVGPVPMHLPEASFFLTGKPVNETIIEQFIEIAQTQISPISDARGTAYYKRLLLGQLIKAHFITLFPDKLKIDKLLRKAV